MILILDNDSGLSCSQSLNMNNLSLNNNINEDFNGQFNREKCFSTSIDSTECDNLHTKDAKASDVEFPCLGTDNNQNVDVTQAETNSENGVETNARISVYDTLYSRRRGIVPRSKMKSETKLKSFQKELTCIDPQRKRPTSLATLKAKKSNAEHIYMNLPCRGESAAEPEMNWYDSDSPPLAMSTPYESDHSPANISPTAAFQDKATPSQTKISAPELNRQLPSGSIAIPLSNFTRQWSSESQTDVQELKDMYRLENNRTKIIKDVPMSPVETPPVVSPLNLFSQILHQHDPNDDTDYESNSVATNNIQSLSNEEISVKNAHICSLENEKKSK